MWSGHLSCCVAITSSNTGTLPHIPETKVGRYQTYFLNGLANTFKTFLIVSQTLFFFLFEINTNISLDKKILILVCWLTLPDLSLELCQDMWFQHDGAPLHFTLREVLFYSLFLTLINFTLVTLRLQCALRAANQNYLLCRNRQKMEMSCLWKEF